MEKIIWIGKKISDKTLGDESSGVVERLENQLNIKFGSPIKVRLHESRASYEQQLDRQGTKNWEVGNTSENDEIDILHPDIFEKESSHKKEDFIKILRHEIVHICVKKIAELKAVPMWLNEGLSMFLAEQVEQYQNKAGFYIETEYASKLATPFGWNTYANYDAYRFACLFVNFLIKTYGLEMLIKLIKSLARNYDEYSFKKIFNEIFKTTLDNAEGKFLEEISG